MTTSGRATSNPVQERRGPRPDARLQTEEFLGHGNAARLRQLGADQQRAGQGRSARHGLARCWPWRRRRQLLAMAQRSERPGAVSRHTGRRRMATPVPLYSEVAQIGQEFAKAGPVLAGTSPKSEVAILHSYDSRWAIQWQKHNTQYDPIEQIMSYYAAVASHCAVHRHHPARRAAESVQAGGRARTECDFRCRRQKPDCLRAKWRPSRARPALRHER